MGTRDKEAFKGSSDSRKKCYKGASHPCLSLVVSPQIHEIFDQVYPNSEWQLRHPSAEVHERAQVR